MKIYMIQLEFCTNWLIQMHSFVDFLLNILILAFKNVLHLSIQLHVA